MLQSIQNKLYTVCELAKYHFDLLVGIVIRLDDNGNKDYQAMGSGDTRNFRNTYQGYSLITGNFLSRGTEDFAASVPRLNNYFGQVFRQSTII